MRPFRLLCALSLLFLASAAAAADVCLEDVDNGVQYTFKKLKVPKKSGAAVPVVGYALGDLFTIASPLNGTLVRDPSGILVIGFMRLRDRCLASADLADDLTGTIVYDCNLDDAGDGQGELIRIDCPAP